MALRDQYNPISRGFVSAGSYDGRLYHAPDPSFSVADNSNFLGIDHFQIRSTLVSQHLTNMMPDSARGEPYPGTTVTEAAYDEEGNPLHDYTFIHADIVNPSSTHIYEGYAVAPTVEEVSEDLGDAYTGGIWLANTSVTEREVHYTAQAYKDKYGEYPDDYSVVAGIGEGEDYDEVNPGVFLEVGWDVNHGSFYDGQYWAGIGAYDNSYNPERWTDKISATFVGTFFPEDLTLRKDNLTLSSGIFAGAASYPQEVIQNAGLPHLGNRLAIIGGLSFKGEYHFDSDDKSVFLQADVVPAVGDEISGFAGLSAGVKF